MKDSQFNNAICRLDENVYNVLLKLSDSVKEKTFEVRLRSGQPLQITGEYGTLFVRSDSSTVVDYKNCDYKITNLQVKDSLNKICDYSLHTHLSQLQNGFITIKGGHRVGVAATAVISEDEIYNLRDISSLNLRIAHQVNDCSKIIPDRIVFSNDSIIVSGPPLSGKTTILRDLARRLSQSGKRITVIDERNEISAIYNGVYHNDLGPCCDVLNFFPKDKGVMSALRTLSPEIIVCDEIGTMSETNAIIQGLNSGVRFLISIHANSIYTLENKPQFKKLKSSGEFGYAVFLEKNNAQIVSLR